MEGNELGLYTIEKTYFRKIEETKSKIIEGSIRSGIKLEYDGSIVIVGDVNAGAEIIASEDVIVLGTLRGLAHAGATGNRGAVIIANEILSAQVRIADIVKEINKSENDDETIKKKAYVKRDIIIIE